MLELTRGYIASYGVKACKPLQAHNTGLYCFTHTLLTAVHLPVGSVPHVGVICYRHSLDAKYKLCAHSVHFI